MSFRRLAEIYKIIKYGPNDLSAGRYAMSWPLIDARDGYLLFCQQRTLFVGTRTLLFVVRVSQGVVPPNECVGASHQRPSLIESTFPILRFTPGKTSISILCCDLSSNDSFLSPKFRGPGSFFAYEPTQWLPPLVFLRGLTSVHFPLNWTRRGS